MGEVVKLVSGRARAKAALPKPRDCDECGEPIETARLQVMPTAKRCVGCEQLREVRHQRVLAQAQDEDIVIIRR